MERKKLVFLSLQIVIVLCIFASLIVGHFKKEPDIEVNSFESDYVQYDNGCHVAEGDIAELNDKVTLLTSDKLELKSGTYTAYVWYEADSDQHIYFCDGGELLFSSNEYSCLRSFTNLYDYDFTIKNQANEFRLLIEYNGSGNLDINRVVISRNQNGKKRALTMFILLFVACDLCYVFRDVIRRNYKVAITLLGAWLLPAIPLFNGSSCPGYDYTYHTLRFEAIVRELENGIFPVRMDSLFFGGAGYPSSIFYNDLLLYVPALFRRMGFYIWESNNIYFLFISALSVGIAYFCFRKMFSDNRIGAILSLLYVTSPYRLDMYYEGSGIGIVTAYTFVPFIALGVWEMYAETDSFDCKKAAMYIVLGMTGLVGCHILTTEVVCFALVIVVFSRIRTTFSFKVLKTWIVAAIVSILLNCYFLVPFLDYYISVDTLIKKTVASSLVKIQVFGMTIAEYLAFFTNPLDGPNNNYQCSPGAVLIAAFIVALVAIYLKMQTNRGKYITVMALVFLFMSSAYFPWDWLGTHTTIGRILCQVQFPTRWLCVATILLSILLGEMLSNKNVILEKLSGLNFRILSYAIVGFTFAITIYYVGMCMEQNVSARGYSSNVEELNVYVVGMAEYLIEGTDRSLLPGEYVFRDVNCDEVSKNGTKIEMTVKCGQTEGYVEVPLLNYKYFRAWDKDDNILTVVNGENNRVGVMIPEGYDGRILIDFKPPVFWDVSMYISLVTAMALIIGALYPVIRRGKEKRNME